MKSLPYWVLGFAVLGVHYGSFAAETNNEEKHSETTDEAGELEEVVVLGFRKANLTEITENAEKLLNMPGSLGDPLGSITALPGVVSPQSGGAPAVRGSSPSDNRYYIDGMPAGYIFHEFNTSIFDENVLQDFQMFSAGFGVQYSEATGGIFDIRLRDPKNKAMDFTTTMSMLRAGIFVESALGESSAFYLSLRKGLIQYFVSEEDEPDEDGMRIVSAPEDSDYQFKYKWELNDNHDITLSAAGANDFAQAEFTDSFNEAQKNPDFAGLATIDRKFSSVGINYTFESDSDWLTKWTFANYTDNQITEWGADYFLNLELSSQLARGHFSFPLSKNNTLNLGGEFNEKEYDFKAALVEFICTEFDPDCQDGRGDFIRSREIVDIQETSFYISNNWQMTESFMVEVGIQRSGNNYNDNYYTNPRISIQWDLNGDSLSLIGSAGKYNRTQNIENILEAVGNPQLKSLTAEHYTLGFKGYLASSWNWLVEGYFKELSNLPLALNENDADGDLRYQNDVEGEVHGFDIMLNKELIDRWSGWVSLSIAESERTNLRTDETRTYTFDTPLVFNLVSNYRINNRWTAGVRYTLKSGEASTEIVGVKPNEDFPGRYLAVYSDDTYGDRLPTYSRLDLRFEREFTAFDNDASFFIDILNVLDKENVDAEVLNYEKVNENGELHTEYTTDMGIFGSVGVSFTF